MMRVNLKKRAVLCGLLLTLTAGAEETSFRVLTYNLNVHQSVFGKRHMRSKIKEILLRIHGYDFVALQEVFNPVVREEIQKNSTFPYFKFGGGGLVILSQFPILESKSKKLKGCSFRGCLQADGILVSKIRIDESRFLYFANIKLEENTWNPYSLTIRRKQLKEVETTIEDLKYLKQPLIVLGSFNIYPNGRLYQKFVSELNMRDVWSEFQSQISYYPEWIRRGETLVKSGGRDRVKRFDYIFYAPNGEEISLVSSHVVMKSPFEKELLSDRFGLESTFRYKNRQ